MHIDEIRKYHQEKEHLMRNEGAHPANQNRSALQNMLPDTEANREWFRKQKEASAKHNAERYGKARTQAQAEMQAEADEDARQAGL